MFRWFSRKPARPEAAAKADIPRLYVVEDTASEGVPVLERKWYYKVEIEPGVFTDAVAPDTVHLTRSALRNVDLRGRSALDIGTMEGLVPTLMARRGAAPVLAYDRLRFPDRIDWIRQRYQVDFDYRCGFPLSKLSETLGEDEHPLFDVVVFSGVLYHMFDPFAGILTARRFVRNGGLMILETAAVLSTRNVAYFNEAGRFYDGDNFWFCSVANLDYMLRMARLRPIDCTFMRQAVQRRLGEGDEGDDLCRVCIVCEATDQAVAGDGDDWILNDQKKDFAEYVRWADFTAPVGDVVGYTVPEDRQLVRRGSGLLDIYSSLRSQKEERPTDADTQVALRLDAVY